MDRARDDGGVAEEDPPLSGYVTLGVRDLAASRRFWCDTLGLAVAGEWPNQVSLNAGAFEVLLDATGEYPPARLEVGLHVTRAQIEAIASRANPFRGPKDFGGPLGWEAALRDPDGYVIVLYEGK